jgi:hypothetical protein
MQTFLPYHSFAASARALDRVRLGNQRREAWQILRCNILIATAGPTAPKKIPGTGWRNHPAVRMWRGYEGALCLYGIAVCEEWVRRGYRDSLRERFAATLTAWPDTTLPPWWKRGSGVARAVQHSHRRRLVDKLPSHYGALWPGVLPGGPEVYVWPVETIVARRVTGRGVALSPD